jgi:putative SOS response-associated peptidase YedK
MAIASIWDTWTNPENGELVVSFSMLTMNAKHHPVMNRFHKPDDEKRTVIPIRSEFFKDWLDASPQSAMELLNPNMMSELMLT